ncbi:hypothetical protein BJ973_002792 [Actinoplanes tereljensis]|uniref:Tat pathway signal protein n=1 Tax=Paractinoplanes tereljensis TaxID=571912 RepID=A0A919NQH5_9ACTN|nr:hypothetical protein [Actinoplanes tereljensis]GIF22468.1 Tat pathway signal protein [Actinoplanes tereljensis]
MSWVDELRRREDACRRAPSAHNTQPWILRYAEEEVTVHWDPDRALPDSDPTRRDLFLSLGAFVETCLIVATGAGLAVRAEIAVDEDERRVARIVAAGTAYATPFSAAAVDRRRCARGPYRPGHLPEPTAGVRRLPSRRLAGMLSESDRRMFGTPAVARELRQWLRLSPRHPRYALDGLTDRALGLSRLEAAGLAAALSPVAYAAGRRLGLPAVLAASPRSLLRYDGDVLVLVGRADTAEHLVEQGRTLMRVWLDLSERGLAVHPLSQILDCAATARTLEGLLGLEVGFSALAVFRAGHPLQEPARSARIPASNGKDTPVSSSETAHRRR